jgi:hypothetical protein
MNISAAHLFARRYMNGCAVDAKFMKFFFPARATRAGSLRTKALLSSIGVTAHT